MIDCLLLCKPVGTDADTDAGAHLLAVHVHEHLLSVHVLSFCEQPACSACQRHSRQQLQLIAS